jgi:hypothetical protein
MSDIIKLAINSYPVNTTLDLKVFIFDRVEFAANLLCKYNV